MHQQTCHGITLHTLLCPDPHILPHVQVDKGAIRFVLSGANIMSPGLTSPGGRMDVVGQDKAVVYIDMKLKA